MDPITAISLAGTVVQFVDYTAKLIPTGTQLYSFTELTSNIEAARSASFIRDQATDALRDLQYYRFKLQQRMSPGITPEPLARDEKILQALCDKCTEDADALIKLLNKIQVPETSKHRGWKVWRKHFQAFSQRKTLKD
jgi:hypothetical protein